MANSKATELGDSFIVVEMDRSVVKLTPNKVQKLERRQKIIKEVEQSYRLIIPNIILSRI